VKLDTDLARDWSAKRARVIAAAHGVSVNTVQRIAYAQ
jgi:hypothetical protein